MQPHNTLVLSKTIVVFGKCSSSILSKMAFTVRDRIYYNGMYGMVSHVGENYIVMDVRTNPGRDYPRVIIFPERFSEVRQIRDHKND